MVTSRSTLPRSDSGSCRGESGWLTIANRGCRQPRSAGSSSTGSRPMTTTCSATSSRRLISSAGSASTSSDGKPASASFSRMVLLLSVLMVLAISVPSYVEPDHLLLGFRIKAGPEDDAAGGLAGFYRGLGRLHRLARADGLARPDDVVLGGERDNTRNGYSPP